MSFGKSKCDELFEIQANTLIDFRTMNGDALHVTQVAFSPNGKLLALALWYGTISLWSVEECKIKCDFKSPFESPGFMTFSSDGTLVVYENGTGLVRVFDTETGEVKNEMRLEWSRKLEFSSNGRLVAAAPVEDGRIELWYTEKREIKHVFPRTWEAPLYDIKLSSNGEVMAVQHPDGCTILWKTGKGIQERTFSGDLSVSPVVFSPNNQVMALVEAEEILFGDETWFRDKHGQASKRISGFSPTLGTFFGCHSTLGIDIVFSRDGKLAALVMMDSKIRLYNTGKGEEEMRVLEGHSKDLSSVAFSPISPLLASASWDHTVILWDTEKGEKLCTLEAHSDVVIDVAFSPNGELVTTVSHGGIVGLWNVSQWMTNKN